MDIRKRSPEFKKILSTGISHRREDQEDRRLNDRKSLIESLRMATSMADDIDPLRAQRRTHKTPICDTRLYSKTFMHPDTMIEIPENLSSDWMVMLRPEGERCLIVVNSNTVVIRSRNGSIIAKYILEIFSLKRPNLHAIFDGVFVPGNFGSPDHVFVMDVILFNGNEILNSEFEFRNFFLRENWPFTDSHHQTPVLDDTDSVEPVFVRLGSSPATEEALAGLYVSTPYTPIENDSLIFFRKSGKYENGLTQEALFFRDNHLSKYCIDTQQEDGYSGNESQDMVLDIQTGEDGKVRLQTWDKVCVKEYESLDIAIEAGIPKPLLKNKTRVRVSMSMKFEFSNFSSSRKPFATSFNRIVDQYRKRRQLDLQGESIFSPPPPFDKLPICFKDIVNVETK